MQSSSLKRTALPTSDPSINETFIQVCNIYNTYILCTGKTGFRLRVYNLYAKLTKTSRYFLSDEVLLEDLADIIVRKGLLIE